VDAVLDRRMWSLKNASVMRNALLSPPAAFERSALRSKTGAEGSPARRLFDASVVLCASQGFQVTVRDIAALAKTNLAAINYYYESKENLMQLVVEAATQPINEMMLSQLNAYEDFVGEGRLDASHVWSALAAPLIRCSMDEEAWYSHRARIYIRAVLLENMSTEEHSINAHFDVISKRFLKALSRALPELSSDEIKWRFYFGWGTILTATRDAFEGASNRKGGKPLLNVGNLDELLKHLVVFLSKATSK